ncbi:MAG: hypothetical protein KDA73_02900 [Rhodobacteraceae bacterium]|nr:hypothetical protein [Paracoccaceae bacterium]
MRRLAVLSALPALLMVTPAAAPAQSQEQAFAKLAGKTNMAAIQAAASCRTDEAMALAQKAAKSRQPGERLFAEFAQAAVYTEAGQSRQADAILDAVTRDKTLNPDGASRAQMQQGADALLETIRGLRQSTIGRRRC